MDKNKGSWLRQIRGLKLALLQSRAAYCGGRWISTWVKHARCGGVIVGLLFVLVWFGQPSYSFIGAVTATTDRIGVVRIAQREAVVIGMWLYVGDSPSDDDPRRGVELALEEVGGQLLGHPIRLIHTQAGPDAQHIQRVISEWARTPRLLAVVGPDDEQSLLRAGPTFWQSGIVSVVHDIVPRALLPLGQRPGYEGVLFLGGESIEARFARTALKARRAAVVRHNPATYRVDPPSFDILFATLFKEMGGIVVREEVVARGQSEFRSVLARLAAARPEVIYVAVEENEAAQFIKQARAVERLMRAWFIGSRLGKSFLSNAGEAAVGVYILYPELSEQVLSARSAGRYDKFRDRFYKKYGIAGPRDFATLSVEMRTTYDATRMILAAAEKVASQDGAGTTLIGRKALRDALYATKDFPGVAGRLTCNAYGHCPSPNSAIHKFISTRWREGENPRRVFP